MLDQLARHALIDMTCALPMVICISTITTPSRMWAFCYWAGAGPKRYGRQARDRALWVVPVCQWTMPWCGPRLTCPGVRFWCGMWICRRSKIGTFDTELVREFFQALWQPMAGSPCMWTCCTGSTATILPRRPSRRWPARLRVALEVDPRSADAIPSTKGAL